MHTKEKSIQQDSICTSEHAIHSSGAVLKRKQGYSSSKNIYNIPMAHSGVESQIVGQN